MRYLLSLAIACFVAALIFLAAYSGSQAEPEAAPVIVESRGDANEWLYDLADLDRYLEREAAAAYLAGLHAAELHAAEHARAAEAARKAAARKEAARNLDSPRPNPSPAGDVFDRIAQCESNMNPRAYNPAGPYFSYFQWSLSTWVKAGGRGHPYDASYATQKALAQSWAARTSLGSQWPSCSRQIGAA